MKRDAQVGTIAVGRRADLILVEGRPDRSFTDIRKVISMIAAGRVFDRAQLWKSVGLRR
jgi:imidazolonepropionase-like amidohydrolase